MGLLKGSLHFSHSWWGIKSQSHNFMKAYFVNVFGGGGGVFFGFWFDLKTCFDVTKLKIVLIILWEPFLLGCGVKLTLTAFNRNLTNHVKTPNTMKMKTPYPLIQINPIHFSIRSNPAPNTHYRTLHPPLSPQHQSL